MAGQECILPPHPHYAHVFFAISLATLLTSLTPALAADGKLERLPAGHNQQRPLQPILINNILNYYGNNGDGVTTDTPGTTRVSSSLKVPRDTCCLKMVSLGRFSQRKSDSQSGGSLYRHGLQAGRIQTDGTHATDPIAEDPTLLKYRVYDTAGHFPFHRLRSRP